MSIFCFYGSKKKLSDFSSKIKFGETVWSRGGLRGGGTPPPSGIRPPADPIGPPFDTFSEIHFWPTDPIIFLKAP